MCLFVNSLSYANTDKFDLDTLLKGKDYPSAIEQLDSLITSLDSSRDVELWTITFLRSARLRGLQSEHKIALNYLKSKQWPDNLLANTVLKIATASEIEHYLNHKSWSLVPHSGRNEALASVHAGEYHQLITELDNHYHSALTDSIKKATTLEQASAYFTTSEYPAHVRGFLADLVARRWKEFLSDDLYWSPGHQKQLSHLSLARLLTDESNVDEGSPEQHPLVRIKRITEQLFSWHHSAGRREAAFEIYRYYTRLLNRHFSTAEDTQLLSEFLAEKLHKLSAQYPWWTMGQYQLSLFKQQMPHKMALLEAHDLAVQASIAHPSSQGAQFSKALLRELEYQEFSISGQRSSAVGQPSLKVDYRNLYRLYFKAWRVNDPLPPSLEEGELRVVVDELLKQEADAEWMAELNDHSDLHYHQTSLIPQIKEYGQWLLMASPQAEFADVPEKVQLLNLHLSHYVASVSYHNGEFRVATYDGLRGRALPNIVVELVEVTSDSSALISSAKTNVHGIAKLIRSKDAAHYQIRLRHGVDSSVIEIPGLLGLRDEQRWSLKPAKALIFTDQASYTSGESIAWSILVKAGESVTEKSPGALVDSVGWIKLYDADNKLINQQQVKTDSTGLASGELRLKSNNTPTDFGTWRIESSWRGTKSIEIKKTVESSLTLNKLPETLLAGQELSFRGSVNSADIDLDSTYISWTLRRFSYETNGDLKSSMEIAQGLSDINDRAFDIFTVLNVDDDSPSQRHRFELQLDHRHNGQSLKTLTKSFYLTNQNHYFTIQSNRAFYEAAAGVDLTLSKSNSQWQGLNGESEWFLYHLNAPNKASSGNNESEWVLGALHNNGEIKHGDNGQAKLHLKNLSAGVYRLRLMDKKSSVNQASHKQTAELDFIVVESGKANSLEAGEVLLAQKASVEVGDTLKLLAGSGSDDQWVRLNILKQGELIASQMLSPGVHLLKLPVTNSHQGGLAFNLEWVERNQIQNKDIFVAVPWGAKQLKLNVSSEKSESTQAVSRLKVSRLDGTRLVDTKAQVLIYYSDSVISTANQEPFELDALYQQFQPSMIRLDNNGASYPYYFRASRRIAATTKADLKHAEIRYSNHNNEAYLGKNNTFQVLPMMLVNSESALGQVSLSSNNHKLRNIKTPARATNQKSITKTVHVQRGFLNDDGEILLVIPESLKGKKVQARILVVTPELETGQLSITLR